MKEYHKINSVYKRDEKTHKFIEGQFSEPEFEYLQNNLWVWTEKIDGTNIRIDWDFIEQKVTIGGRTDNTQIPTFLYTKLQELFPVSKFRELYPELNICLYGEGYGAKIQKGGNYIPDGVDFILFDVRVGDYWLRRNDIVDVAQKLNIGVVPVIGVGTIEEAISLIKKGVISTFGNFMAEGLVMKPEVELCTRMGHRIITKIKHKDF